MTKPPHDKPLPIETAEVIIPCVELSATLEFFTNTLGFRIDAIFPADAPSRAALSGHGLAIRLDTTATGDPGVLRLRSRDAETAGHELVAPNGTRVVLVDASEPLHIPPLKTSLVVQRAADGVWGVGRAGMRYRDLIPDRQGGRFIASHIHIREGGPVPDYPHFHLVHFQMIYCYRGWVRVAYEDQGDTFVLEPGDCVLQPPQIRHRVLESSEDLEVVEISCPAEHETRVDHQITLPTSENDPTRDFNGQKFVRHIAASAEWKPRCPGLDFRDTGIAKATAGVASAVVIRKSEGPLDLAAATNHDELLFLFVLVGNATLQVDAATHELSRCDAAVVPSGATYRFASASADAELLMVTVPG